MPGRRRPAPRSAASTRYVEEEFVTLFDSAAQHAAGLGRRAVTPAEVLKSLAIHGFYKNMPNPATNHR